MSEVKKSNCLTGNEPATAGHIPRVVLHDIRDSVNGTRPRMTENTDDNQSVS